ncbi:hypothetical protein [Pelagovum pacificum]|uniref:Uncharacterized protein n=1 Tax=Pelagovum pacificum TaxID=2588711 RepID=A0A5C5G7I4_9RHOB|nr:hypothetical protein [Pelagovum pacificum]QQA41489.1 hypothetical protein I8N54_11680 [Pelagovum pacificum]TNY30511.1 hypothetical protein FHY64_19820 [Pelagovum pacificum]
MVLIWVVYLQVFFTSFRRQRRPEIIISLGAGFGKQASWFVANLGLEPVFVVDIIVRFETASGIAEAIVTDRTEMSDKDLANPAEATNQGPLSSGSFMSIGNLETLLQRGNVEIGHASEIRGLTITVVAATAAQGMVVGASRHYRLQSSDDGDWYLLATKLHTEQIRGRAGRRDLARRLEDRLG